MAVQRSEGQFSTKEKGKKITVESFSKKWRRVGDDDAPNSDSISRTHIELEESSEEEKERP